MKFQNLFSGRTGTTGAKKSAAKNSQWLQCLCNLYLQRNQLQRIHNGRIVCVTSILMS